MGSDKTKLAAVVLLFLAAGGVYLYWGRPSSPLKPQVSLVCVETGEVFEIDRDDLPSVLPAANPKSGTETLLPVIDEDGKYYVSRRYARALIDPKQLGIVNKYVDPKTLEVLERPR